MASLSVSHPQSPVDISPARRLRPFIAVASLLLAGAAVAAWQGERWLAVHLALAGGVSQLILGVALYFTAAALMVAPPSRRQVAGLILPWTAGVLALAAGQAQREPLALLVAATGGAASLAVFAWALRGTLARTLRSYRWPVRWYATCAAFAAAGGVFGAMLWAGRVGWAPGSARDAHLVLMVFGWCGTAIVGTLHTFLPTVARAPLAHPGWQPATYWSWSVAVAALAAAQASGDSSLLWLAVAALGTAATLLAVNVTLTVRPVAGRLGPAARLIAGAQPLLPLAALLLLVDGATPSPDVRSAVNVAIGAGWVGLTVLGSLLYLTATLAATLAGYRPVARRVERWAATAAPVAVLAWTAATVAAADPIERMGQIVALACVAPFVALAARRVALVVAERRVR